MCEKLSGIHQLYIKEFLENFDNFKNKNEIVTFSIKSSSLIRSKREKENNSPLNDYFQTPIRRVKCLEKDKRIKTLLTELEIERIEKLELQDELKIEQNKVKTISKCYIV